MIVLIPFIFALIVLVIFIAREIADIRDDIMRICDSIEKRKN